MLIGYARISTLDQNLNLQRDALAQAGCAQVFEDEGFSGSKVKRPGLDGALKTLKQGDTLIVWKLDRLGRSMKHLIELTTQFEKDGIEFRSLSDAIDTSTPGGKLYFHLMGAFAEFESNLISERTKAGMAAAKARGQKMGRPRKTPATPTIPAALSLESTVLDDISQQFGLARIGPDPPSDKTH